MTKICKVCKTEKPLNEFNNKLRAKDGKDYLCKLCHREQRLKTAHEKSIGVFQNKSRQARLSQSEKTSRKAEYNRKYRVEKREQIKTLKDKTMLQSKIDGIKHYGGCCQCCGESNIKFLTLEHLNGRDKIKKRRTGKMAWNMARIEGFPDTYTVLCFNCNCAKGAYGICPHKESTNE